MVFVLQEAEASVLALVLRLEVEDDVTEALWRERSRSSQRQTCQASCWLSSLPVTLENSSTICSFVLLLGMEPTNSRLLATDIHTPICFPGRISWLLHCQTDNRSLHQLPAGTTPLWPFPVGACRWDWGSHQLHGLLSRLFAAEGDEGVAPVQAAEGVHH